MDKIRVTRGEGCCFSRTVMEDVSDKPTLGSELAASFRKS